MFHLQSLLICCCKNNNSDEPLLSEVILKTQRIKDYGFYFRWGFPVTHMTNTLNTVKLDVHGRKLTLDDSHICEASSKGRTYYRWFARLIDESPFHSGYSANMTKRA